MTQQPRPCLLHADVHILTEPCLAAIVQHSLTQAEPFSREAHDEYHLDVERAMLDQIIREHHTPAVPAAA